ncbi:HNH endonuclease [Lysobacter arenosi]|uniref:HNH endonuclease n=1 Tax=Lysobacter arenosi TaxID=2795387 RepID=A0ABX7RCB3_9GAMM|nr:HNH endonuclease signature motif containing protein [Lysobacter arenosi]QSX74609.1 HNH endonuclease [Lysobacter arenosi]
MPLAWSEIFENFGVKRVSATDIKRSAYVLNKPQLAVIEAAGLRPSPHRPGTQFNVTLLFDPRPSVRASYYHAMREGAGRPPEARLGTEIISAWLEKGDAVVLGNIGSQVYAAKVPSSDVTVLDVADAVASRATPASRRALIARAKQAKGKPARKTVTSNDFVRDPLVVMGALARADGRCEMPGCTRALFKRTDGRVYLEVHHIQRLADEGDDTLDNAAALCPSCHRELHHGAEQYGLQQALADQVGSLSV